MHRSQSAAEGASAPSNVVRLPTAAPRKVKQRWNKATRESLGTLPRFPEERTYFARFPWMRKAVEQARLINEVETTPELLIITAMFRTLPEQERLKVQTLVACMGLKNSKALNALAWLEYAGGTMNYGEANDIKRALDRLASGECA